MRLFVHFDILLRQPASGARVIFYASKYPGFSFKLFFSEPAGLSPYLFEVKSTLNDSKVYMECCRVLLQTEERVRWMVVCAILMLAIVLALVMASLVRLCGIEPRPYCGTNLVKRDQHFFLRYLKLTRL